MGETPLGIKEIILRKAELVCVCEPEFNFIPTPKNI